MARSLGYLRLLRENRAFRNLWYAQAVSLLGDWLNSLALVTLTIRLSGSGTLVGGVFIAKLLPNFFLGGVAGVLADRVNRKVIMMVSDLLRAVAVLGYLVVDTPGELWLLYVITVFSMSLSAFFDPARSAVIPGITSRKQLLTANALSGATWSIMLAVGSALGGLLLAALGFRIAFLLDSFTFLVSAWFVSRVPVPTGHLAQRTPLRWLGFADILAGVGFLRRHRAVMITVFTKFYWGFAGGGLLLLLTIFGERIFPLHGSGELAVGAYFASRGLGAALGPALVRRCGPIPHPLSAGPWPWDFSLPAVPGCFSVSVPVSG